MDSVPVDIVACRWGRVGGVGVAHGRAHSVTCPEHTRRPLGGKIAVDDVTRRGEVVRAARFLVFSPIRRVQQFRVIVALAVLPGLGDARELQQGQVIIYGCAVDPRARGSPTASIQVAAAGVSCWAVQRRRCMQRDLLPTK